MASKFISKGVLTMGVGGKAATNYGKAIYQFTLLILVYMQNVEKIGVSIHKPLLKQLDYLRGDVSRSRMLQKLVEEYVKRVEITN